MHDDDAMVSLTLVRGTHGVNKVHKLIRPNEKVRICSIMPLTKIKIPSVLVIVWTNSLAFYARLPFH